MATSDGLMLQAATKQTEHLRFHLLLFKGQISLTWNIKSNSFMERDNKYNPDTKKASLLQFLGKIYQKCTKESITPLFSVSHFDCDSMLIFI